MTLQNGEEGVLEHINVSDIQQGWSVKIPMISPMYATIMQAYATTDDDVRDDFLGMLFTNMHNVCMVNSESLHDAFFFLQELMTFPYLLLPEDEMASRMRERFNKIGGGSVEDNEKHIEEMLKYRRELYDLVERKKERLIEEYERQMDEHLAPVDEAQDDTAEQAIGILNEKEQDV